MDNAAQNQHHCPQRYPHIHNRLLGPAFDFLPNIRYTLEARNNPNIALIPCLFCDRRDIEHLCQTMV